MIFLYNILYVMVIVLGFPLIVPLVLVSEKRRETLLPRLGMIPLPGKITHGKSILDSQKRVWVHALSVGEVLSAIPLVNRLKEHSPAIDIVLSASTRTGYDIAGRRFKNSLNGIFYFPYDLAFSVKHITKKIDPDVVVIVETDIWPNFLFEMKRRNIPVILVNARLSKKSFVGYHRLRFFTQRLFLYFVHICTQSIQDAGHFQKLGVPMDRVTITGNIKFDDESRIPGSEEIEALKKSMHIPQTRKILLAGSTHPGEESKLLNAFLRIKKKGMDLCLVVAPRNPKRAESVYGVFHSAGLSVALMKELKEKSKDKSHDVIVVDRLGVLKRLYAVADIAFVGGSLVNCGGHNPLEPAACSKPLLFGHDMSDFSDISKMLLEAGGAIRITDASSLYSATTSLLKDPEKAREMGRNAFQVFKANKGAVGKTMAVIEGYL